MARLDKALNIDDLAGMARRRLPRGFFEYIDRGAEDEVTMRANADSIKQVLIRQRVGVDVTSRDIETTLFGTKLSMPVGVAVTGLASLIHHDGERKLAQAAADAGVPFMIGTSNFTAQSELKPILGDLLWRSIYPPHRPDLLDHQLATAKAADVNVLAVTMDSPVVGNREYMQRNGLIPGAINARFWTDALAAPHWLFGTLLRYMMSGGLPEFGDMPAGERKFLGGTYSWAGTGGDFNWESLRDIRRRWDGVLVAKGVLTAEDARLAAECGVDGIIVSNHGGRSLDGCVATMTMLPEIVDAVAPKVSVMIDGGFRRGADVLKAIAAGASAVFVGRATLFGLAAGGQAGVAHALEIFRSEIDRALAMFGCVTVDQLTPEHLIWPGEVSHHD